MFWRQEGRPCSSIGCLWCRGGQEVLDHSKLLGHKVRKGRLRRLQTWRKLVRDRRRHVRFSGLRRGSASSSTHPPQARQTCWWRRCGSCSCSRSRSWPSRPSSGPPASPPNCCASSDSCAACVRATMHASMLATMLFSIACSMCAIIHVAWHRSSHVFLKSKL